MFVFHCGMQLRHKARIAKNSAAKELGYTCFLPIKIDPKKMYKYRLWKLDAAKDGQWCGGWLIQLENGTYEATSKYSGSDRAESNICRSGTENNGSLVTAKPYNFGFANGVMMFLGGSNKTPILDSKIYLTPANIPIN